MSSGERIHFQSPSGKEYINKQREKYRGETDIKFSCLDFTFSFENEKEKLACMNAISDCFLGHGHSIVSFEDCRFLSPPRNVTLSVSGKERLNDSSRIIRSMQFQSCIFVEPTCSFQNNCSYTLKHCQLQILLIGDNCACVNVSGDKETRCKINTINHYSKKSELYLQYLECEDINIGKYTPKNNENSPKTSLFSKKIVISDTYSTNISINHSRILSESFSIQLCNIYRFVMMNPEFTYPPKIMKNNFLGRLFINTENLPDNTVFSGNEFFIRDSHEALQNFRLLRAFMSKLEDHTQEAEFHALELETRSNLKDTKTIDRLFLNAYRTVSGFGLSLTRPLYTLAGIWCVWSFIYSWLVYAASDLPTQSPLYPILSERYLHKFTGLQMVAPFAMWSKPNLIPEEMVCALETFPILFQPFIFLQTVATLATVALFLMAFRKKFRMS
ncbi:MAG: hypothetical protein HQL54_03650 [Magnetococcales bacterium]|nr:hypothetical protein [Magnetococcales bacterium]